MQRDWKKIATNFIKTELARRDLTYDDLQTKLHTIGVKESTNGINVKINRGTFSFIFFLQVMRAIGVKNLRVEDYFE